MTVRQRINCSHNYNNPPYNGLCDLFPSENDEREDYCPFTYTERGNWKAAMICREYRLNDFDAL